jgi:Holliday junction resolvasome RuvABC endonuclease subunit
MSILAIDPARKCGYACSSGQYGTWDLGDPAERLVTFRRLLLDMVKQHGVSRIAYEDASYGGGKSKVQFHTMAMHNELRGMIKLVAAEVGAELISYVPTTIKKFATGNGRSKKPQMMAACKTILGIVPRDDNEADALWILEMAKQNYLPPAQAAKRAAKCLRAKQAKFKFR